MYKVCKTEQSAARQRELEQYLLKLMLQQNFDDISVSDLCDGCSVPRKAFYRYFSGKRGALHALIDHTLMDQDNHTVELRQQKDLEFRRFMTAYFRYWRSQSALLEAVERGMLWETLVDRMIEHSESAIYFSGRLSPDGTQLEQAYRNRFIMSGIAGALRAWYQGGFAESEDRLAGILLFADERRSGIRRIL